MPLYENAKLQFIQKNIFFNLKTVTSRFVQKLKNLLKTIYVTWIFTTDPKHPQTRVSSFPGFISVARDNE